MSDGKKDRGKRASFDRTTGEVSGSGAGIGNADDTTEDYDSDAKVKMPSEKPEIAKGDISPSGAN